MYSKLLSPSILTADFSNLSPVLGLFEKNTPPAAAVGFLHLDVMDGNFVPNISLGPPIIKSLAERTSLPFDIHLMVREPYSLLTEFVTKNTEYIVVHPEAVTHLDRTLRYIKTLGVKCGVALNPATNEQILEYVYDIVDQVLVMSVNPGFGGQSFDPSALIKIARIAEERERRGLGFKISIDGGVGEANIALVAEAGADIIVSGSAIVNSDDPASAITRLSKILEG